MNSSDTNQVPREILSYFMRNPQAADNLEGIVRWRLLNEVVRRKVDETSVALSWLVKQGFLRETSLPGVGPIFSLNPETLAEAEKFLAAAEVLASSPVTM